MAIIRTAGPTEITDTGATGSTTIMVPAGAGVLVVGVSGYRTGTTAYFSDGNLTLDGASLSVGGRGDSGVTYEQGVLFYQASPAVGAKTLAWDWASTGAPTYGTRLVWSAYSGVDAASPLRTSTGKQFALSTFALGSQPANNGDLAVAYAYVTQTTNVETFAWSGVTEVQGYSNNYRSDVASWAEATVSTDVTITAAPSLESNGGLVALILALGTASAAQPGGIVVTSSPRRHHQILW